MNSQDNSLTNYRCPRNRQSITSSFFMCSPPPPQQRKHSFFEPDDYCHFPCVSGFRYYISSDKRKTLLFHFCLKVVAQSCQTLFSFLTIMYIVPNVYAHYCSMVFDKGAAGKRKTFFLVHSSSTLLHARISRTVRCDDDDHSGVGASRYFHHSCTIFFLPHSKNIVVCTHYWLHTHFPSKHWASQNKIFVYVCSAHIHNTYAHLHKLVLASFFSSSKKKNYSILYFLYLIF